MTSSRLDAGYVSAGVCRYWRIRIRSGTRWRPVLSIPDTCIRHRGGSRRIAADRGGEGAGGACHVQWFTPGTQHYWDNPGVAGESAGGIGVDRSTEGQLGCADSALQYGQVDGEHVLGAFPALGGELPLAQRAGREVDEGVGVGLRGGAQVDCGVGAGGGVRPGAQRAAEDFGGFPVESSG
jgi:hypothetical protein